MSGFAVNTAKRLVQDTSLQDRLKGGSRSAFHGTCSSPVEIFLRGAPDKLLVSLGIERKGSAVQWISVRCRKCPDCQQHRSHLWAARAIDEVKASQRTWFGTLTIAPDARFKAKLNAAHRVTTHRREPWDSIPASEQFKAIQEELAPEVTKWLKRVREESGAPLRYLLVCEAHKDGFPHYHILLHEMSDRVSNRVLEKHWRLGFSHWRLVKDDNPSVVWYACKYLSKSALTRVRASKDYGQPHLVMRLLTERLTGATRSLVAAGKAPATTNGTPTVKVE